MNIELVRQQMIASFIMSLAIAIPVTLIIVVYIWKRLLPDMLADFKRMTWLERILLYGTMTVFIAGYYTGVTTAIHGAFVRGMIVIACTMVFMFVAMWLCVKMDERKGGDAIGYEAQGESEAQH